MDAASDKFHLDDDDFLSTGITSRHGGASGDALAGFNPAPSPAAAPLPPPVALDRQSPPLAVSVANNNLLGDSDDDMVYTSGSGNPHHESQLNANQYQHDDDDEDVRHQPQADATLQQQQQQQAAFEQRLPTPSSHSSTDDFEHVEQPKMTDNLLDFDQPAPTQKLVDVVFTEDDFVKGSSGGGVGGAASKEAAGVYLENEFTDFSSKLRDPEFTLSAAAAKPMKDVYSDFMEAERNSGYDSSEDKLSQPVTPAKVAIVPEKEPPVVVVEEKPLLPPPIPLHIREPEVPVMKPQPVMVVPEPPVKNVTTKDSDDLVNAFVEPKVEDLGHDIVKVATAAAAAEVTKVEAPVVPPVAQPKPAVSTAAAAAKPKDELIISAEEMFCKFGLDAWFKPERLHPQVESLIYWRDVKKSGIVFGAGLVVLLAVSLFSVISVFAYVSLISLVGTISFRIYKSVMQAVQKTSDGHPFKEFLDFELQLPQEKVQQVTGIAVTHINSILAELRRLFLVDDIIDSVKFGLMLWCLTYVGAWFNGMTLVILSFVALFTLPKVYENNKQSIDMYLDLVRHKIAEITEKVKSAIPIGKKAESEKDK